MSAPENVALQERRLAVDSVSRVEGEGRLRVLVRGDEVVDARLEIFEAPRFFERLVVGRTPDEVIDIVARICGICPVAYQLTAAMAFERAFGVELDPEVSRLRRLLYHGEWLQSHALHLYLLHAPDFLGYPDALAMAADHRPIVERGLRLKHAGVRILEVLGGRSVHPVSLRVGGFHRVPSPREIDALRPELEAAHRDALETLDWVAGFRYPAFARLPSLLALVDPVDYPLDTGRIRSSAGLDLDPGDWESAFEEVQVEGTTALVARGRDGRHHLLGPAARVGLAAGRLHPEAAAGLDAVGGPAALVGERFRSIVARAVEMVHATASALELLDGLKAPARPWEPWRPRPGVAAWSTEAPRGLLFHRYDIDENGLVAAARIVPPTSQNQAAIEDDLRAFLPSVLPLPDPEATARLEALIRCYDPCISCATHFLTLEVEEAPR
jgi:coenzyme F420-reducing hydrogenase alpha subunit